MSLRNIYYSLSPELRLAVRKLYYLPHDLLQQLSGKRSELQPGKGDIYIGSGDFLSQGKKQVQTLTDHIDLKESDVVLDIGCGIGRTALPLTKILTTGRYEGFDVVKKGVDWCKRNIGINYPNFHFTFVSLHNDLYNNFKAKGEEFSFPYPDRTFDKVFLFSVFTHMRIEEIQHYLTEIKRVLKPEGKCLATFFLYDKDFASKGPDDGFSFPYEYPAGYRLMSKKVQSANIAISLDLLNRMMDTVGLEIEKIEFGYWNGKIAKDLAVNFQDTVIIKSK